MKLQFSISELSSYLDEVFPQVVNRYRIVDLQQGYARVIQNITQENLRPGGTVSGPTIFSLVDIGMYILLLAHVGKEPLAVTTNCSIDFLKKPTMDEELFADCNLLKLGKTLSVGDVLIYSEDIDEPVAHASLTYSIPQK